MINSFFYSNILHIACLFYQNLLNKATKSDTNYIFHNFAAGQWIMDWKHIQVNPIATVSS